MWSADQPETAISTYRPLALATLAVDWQLWHARAAGYHATNVLLHVLATLALFLALTRSSATRAPPARLALLFALHPANAEAVAWINGRSEMLALGCGALALSRRACDAAMARLAVALLAAMLGKETGVVFVPLAVALAAGGRARGARRRRRCATAAYAALRALRARPRRRAVAPRGRRWPRSARSGPAPPSLLWCRWRRAPIELSTWIASLTPHARATWALAGAALAGAALALAARRRWVAALALAWWLGADRPDGDDRRPRLPVARPRPLALRRPARPAPRRRAGDAPPADPRAASPSPPSPRCSSPPARSDRSPPGTTTKRSTRPWSPRPPTTPGPGAPSAPCASPRAATPKPPPASTGPPPSTTPRRSTPPTRSRRCAWARLGRCDEAVAQFDAHPETPALKTEDFKPWPSRPAGHAP